MRARYLADSYLVLVLLQNSAEMVLLRGGKAWERRGGFGFCFCICFCKKEMHSLWWSEWMGSLHEMGNR